VPPSTPPASVVMAPTHISADTLEGYTSSSCDGVGRYMAIFIAFGVR
jgi:hypothetical protein